MSEYINREEYFKIAHKFYYKNPPYDSSYQEGYNRGLDCASHEIGKLQTADVVPVRHGRWIHCFEDWRKQIDGDKCSVCGFEHYGSGISHYHYCPNCGAKMDLGGAENDE